MELIDTVLIERIRKALIKRYDRDQQIQQMIEEIGAEVERPKANISVAMSFVALSTDNRHCSR